MQLFPTYTIMPETSSDVTPADCVLGEALTDPCTEDASLCGKSFSKERLAWYLYDAGNSAIGGGIIPLEVRYCSVVYSLFRCGSTNIHPAITL